MLGIPDGSLTAPLQGSTSLDACISMYIERDFVRSGMPDGLCVGREDIDALMLGTGRPFIAEILNARSAMLPLEHFQRLQQQLLEVPSLLLFICSNYQQCQQSICRLTSPKSSASAEIASAAKRAVMLSSCALMRGQLCHCVASDLAQVTSAAGAVPASTSFLVLQNLLTLPFMAVS